MRLSSLLAWIGVILIFIGLAYPLLMLLGFGVFLVGTIWGGIQRDRTWKALDKKLREEEK